MIWPVILSGGAGTRLWPLSRAERPKQLLPLVGEQTMIQATAARTGDATHFRAPLVVANEAHRAAIVDQLGAIGVAPAALLLEPAGRNTAPAIALAAHRIAADDPAALMLVMPSDHVIADVDAFLAAVAALEPFVREGWLATFGIRATAPETGYGYIEQGDALGAGVRRVVRFVEKPDRATAERYVADGRHAWNGGIFLMRADRYLAALEAHAPKIAGAVAQAMAGARIDGLVIRPDAAAFAACPSDSIDYAVMEHDDRVAVAPVDMGWSDIGSWDALWSIADRDGDGNAVAGDTVLVDARECLVRSDGPLVSLVGVEGLTVVAGRDAVLIAGRGHSQDVKKIVDRLSAAGRSEPVAAARLDHGWGREELLARAGAASVRLLTVAADAELRRETATRLTLIDGDATVDGRPVERGAAFELPAGATMHAIGGAAVLVAVEIV